MAVFEVHGPDGKIYEVEADTIEQAATAFDVRPREYADGAAPEDYFTDPRTGAMVSRPMLARNMPMTPARAAQVGGMEGLALGGSDEAIGAMAAAVPGGANYEFGREYTRAANEKAREEKPVAYYGAMIPGAVATTVGGWGATGISPFGQSVLGTLGRGGAMGATEGAIQGGLSAEGGVMPRAMSALTNAAIGGGIGVAAVPAAKLIQQGGRAIGDMASGVFELATGRGNASKANRAIAETLMRSGKSADDVTSAVARAAMEGQPQYRMVDALGQAGQRRASGVVRAGGDGAEELAAFLRQRAIDAPDRMIGFVDEAFPASHAGDVANAWSPGSVTAPPRTAAQATAAMTAGRGAAADAAYSAARGNAGPVDVRGALSVIDDRIGGMAGSNVTGDGIDASLARFRGRLAAGTPPNGTTAVELSDFDRVLGVKQDVQDAIGVAVRAGRNNEARELTKLAQALDSALEDASTGYRAANDGFRRMSRAIDAVDEGKTMARRGRPEDTIPRFQGMSGDEQIAARAGYGDTIIDDISRKKAEAPDVSREFASTKRKAEADAMAENPDLFLRRVGREGDMHGVYSRALTGSRTADNLQDIGDLGMAANATRAARDLMTLNIPGALQNAGAVLGPIMNGMPEGTRTLVARALMSDNPQASLAAAAKSAEMSQGVRNVLQALLRGSARQPALEATR